MELYCGTLTLNCMIHTQNMLGSYHSKYPQNWIIVDNGSTDNTHILLDDLSQFPNQLSIRNRQNKGVAGGWNQIIRRALSDLECKYIYIVNNDVTFEKDSCDVLIDFLKAHPEYITVSSIEINRFKPTAGHIDDKAMNFVAFMLTRKCVEVIGFFDEQFHPAYFEDNDYHQRIIKVAWPQGLKSCVMHDSHIHHKGSRTVNEGGVKLGNAFNANRFKFKAKWGFIP